jgi:two-component system, cell cycle sensor histidine kinase DivJ
MFKTNNINMLMLKVLGLAIVASVMSMILMPLSFALLQAGVIAALVYLLHRTGEKAAPLADNYVRFTASGAIEEVSAPLKAIFEPMNNAFFEHLHPEDKPLFLKAFAQKIATTQILRLVQTRRALEGSLQERVAWLEGAIADSSIGLEVSHYLEVSFTIKNNQYLALVHDVSARERENQRITTLQAQTARAQEMKTRFLATITHELRTPLNAVIGFSQMLLNEETMGLTPAKRVEYATLIHEAGDHLLSIVNSILDMSKLESGKFDFKPDYFSLQEMLESCHAIIGLKAEANSITLYKHVEQELSEIYADKRAIRQILLNLLANAVKFTKAGGAVTTHVQRKGNRLILSVADTGIGIASEDLPHIGEAFYQAKGNYDRPFEGTGLGLSVVKGLVALHKGQMKISSTLGEGTIISISLPLDAEDELAIASQDLTPSHNLMHYAQKVA